MTNWERGLLAGACVIGIAAGLLVINKTTRIDCFDWFGLGAKTCAITTR